AAENESLNQRQVAMARARVRCARGTGTDGFERALNQVIMEEDLEPVESIMEAGPIGPRDLFFGCLLFKET
ncbi:hypothetical protein GWO18_04595, partial [Candidatus Bathyarchaeota archaeon]|nr:hypothetical protein [Candidatus Bathyarchaeota archaeon]